MALGIRKEGQRLTGVSLISPLLLSGKLVIGGSQSYTSLGELIPDMAVRITRMSDVLEKEK